MSCKIRAIHLPLYCGCCIDAKQSKEVKQGINSSRRRTSIGFSMPCPHIVSTYLNHKWPASQPAEVEEVNIKERIKMHCLDGQKLRVEAKEEEEGNRFCWWSFLLQYPNERSCFHLHYEVLINVFQDEMRPIGMEHGDGHTCVPSCTHYLCYIVCVSTYHHSSIHPIDRIKQFKWSFQGTINIHNKYFSHK